MKTYMINFVNEDGFIRGYYQVGELENILLPKQNRYIVYLMSESRNTPVLCSIDWVI